MRSGVRSEDFDGVTTARAPTRRPAAIALIAFLPALLGAQDGATAVITGRVTLRTDTTAALAPAHGATVTIVGSGRATSTGPDGRFVFERVAPGALAMRVRLLGYRLVERAI